MNTAERLVQVINRVAADVSSARVAAMQLEAEFVLTPRTELPEVIESENGVLTTDDDTGCASYPDSAARQRKVAYARLALAEAVEARNAEQEAAKAAEVAADTAKLDAEALALYNAAWESEAAEMPGVAAEKFRRLALAARRIHGVTK